MNPSEAMHKLQGLLRQRAAAIGLEMHQTIWHPGATVDDPTILTVYFHIDPDHLLTEDDEFDKQFESIIGSMDEPPKPKPINRLKKEMEDRLRNGGSLLGD